MFDAKGGGDVLSFMLFMSLACVLLSHCNMRLSVVCLNFIIYPCLYEFKCLSIPMLITYPCVGLLQLIIFVIIHG
jgi:hypothetical protein